LVLWERVKEFMKFSVDKLQENIDLSEGLSRKHILPRIRRVLCREVMEGYLFMESHRVKVFVSIVVMTIGSSKYEYLNT
jgi:hypothetical protein